MKVIKDLELNPPPAVAIIPLGTGISKSQTFIFLFLGNDLSRTFKWGSTFKKKWIQNNNTIYQHLKEVKES